LKESPAWIAALPLTAAGMTIVLLLLALWVDSGADSEAPSYRPAVDRFVPMVDPPQPGWMPAIGGSPASGGLVGGSAPGQIV